MKVLFATSELAPWVKTGGLADVSAALPEALLDDGIDIRILVPAYPALKAAFPDAPMVAAILAPPGQMHGAAIRQAKTPSGVTLYLLECNVFFDRPGNPYLGPEGLDWLDNVFRFGLFSHVAALLSSEASPLHWHPDVLHCNDWQTGLAPAYLKYWHAGRPGYAAKTVITIHNLAFQGRFERDYLTPLGLPYWSWAMDGVELYGSLSFLKAGLQHADAITTVSPTYAKEIQTESGGMGMDGLLRYRSKQLTGIVNGMDTRQWNPATDAYLAAPYDDSSMVGKAINKKALQQEFGLPVTTDTPLLGIVSRLTHQKGLDLIPLLAEALAAIPVQVVIFGTGERGLEAAFHAMAAEYPHQFAVRIGFDEGVAHRIEAGADLFLMPSRFEPCGLNQLYSLRYGTLPVVRATGGLADTVFDAENTALGNGFVFHEATSAALLEAIQRATRAWHDKASFAMLQRRAMRTDYSWRLPAKATAEIYRSLIDRSLSEP